MQLPIIHGTIDRRILVNFRADPEVVQRILPAPFRPRLIHGVSLVGICLIRLKGIRPGFLPAWCGIESENAAHRIAVEWDEGHETGSGVFVPCRDTSSRWNALAGGRLFPGLHHPARFDVDESDTAWNVAFDRLDGMTHVAVRTTAATSLPPTSVFATHDEASEFFARDSLGYSPARAANTYDGLELCTHTWRIEPLAVQHVESSFFDDPARFPPGTIAFDSAFLMHDIEHEWHMHEPLCCGALCNEPSLVIAEEILSRE
ncbi:MAG: DUF2071 domain-containing protein [Planctomycetaceae bacterium]|nr:DUF2071 domain-containing protein [Planctomycetaceae bacterium]